MICEICGTPMTWDGETLRTLVGYGPQKEGHDHDDNCRTRYYTCQNNHTKNISKQNKCPVCDWIGKRTCFCHDGEKVVEWPDVELNTKTK